MKRLLSFFLCFGFCVNLIGMMPVKATEYQPGFSFEKLTKTVKKKITGISFPKNKSQISYGQLRLVTVKYYDFKGRTKTGKLIVNKKIAHKTVKIFEELYEIKYPLQRIDLVDDYGADDTKSMKANNTSAFNYRMIAGTTKLSMHGKGLAIDINPRINPCVKNGKVEPVNGKAYAMRNRKKCRGKYKKYMIKKNDRVYRIFKKYGFTWGGDWNSLKDYQHFEYTA